MSEFVSTMTPSGNEQAIVLDAIPAELKERPQWVLWKHPAPGKKIPYQTNGVEALPNDPTTWTSFDDVTERFALSDTFAGIGFEFSADDPYCGIDLDGCRNPDTGEIAEWATYWLTRFDTYSEISPSRTGLKLICRGTNTKGRGGNAKIDETPISFKEPGVEIYDQGRFFTITGWHVASTPLGVKPAQDAIAEFVQKYFAAKKPNSAAGAQLRLDLIERCWKYCSKTPDAISGNNGHNKTFRVACECFRFGLLDHEALEVLRRFNAGKTGDEQWNEQQLQHKLQDARERVTLDGEFGVRLLEGNRLAQRVRQQAGHGEPTPLDVLESSQPSVVTLGAAKPSNGRPMLEPPRFTKLLTSRDLLNLDIRPQFIVKNILVEGQPGVIGGRSKCLKTTIALDLGLSLDSGTPFLGKFPAEQRRVAVWSGESGAGTIRETARRVAAAKGIDLAESRILWCFDLPRLGHQGDVVELERVVRENEIQVVLVDPLYLALLDATNAGQASNVYAMGAMLHPVTEMGQRTGATIIVLHHFKRSAQKDEEPASLEMLAQAGIVEWVRQWVLLERRSPYEGDGLHDLWMRCGGSAGHAGLWAVKVDEGVLDVETMSGRQWCVEVQSVIDVQSEVKRSVEQRKAEQREQQDADDRRKMLDALLKVPQGETKSGLRELTGLNSERAGRALTTLLGEGRLLIVSIKKHTRHEQGYQYVEK